MATRTVTCNSGFSISKEIDGSTSGISYNYIVTFDSKDLTTLPLLGSIKNIYISMKCKTSRSNTNLYPARCGINEVGVFARDYYSYKSGLSKTNEYIYNNCPKSLYLTGKESTGLLSTNETTYTFDLKNLFGFSPEPLIVDDGCVYAKVELYYKGAALSSTVTMKDVSLIVEYEPPYLNVNLIGDTNSSVSFDSSYLNSIGGSSKSINNGYQLSIPLWKTAQLCKNGKYNTDDLEKLKILNIPNSHYSFSKWTFSSSKTSNEMPEDMYNQNQYVYFGYGIDLGNYYYNQNGIASPNEFVLIESGLPTITISAVTVPETFTIKFVDWDDKVISTKSDYTYGQTVTIPNNPTRKADNTYTWSFKGWDSPVTAATSNKVYKAVYNGTYIDYTIKWIDENNNAYKTIVGHYGDVLNITVSPVIPEGKAFLGWSPEYNAGTTAITGDATYKEVFTGARIKVTFDYTSSEDSVIYVDYGSSFTKNVNGNPCINGKSSLVEGDNSPDSLIEITHDAKSDDIEFSYSFDSWVNKTDGKDIYYRSITSNITFEGSFKATTRTYKVKFYDYSSNSSTKTLVTTSSVRYGDKILPPHATFEKKSDNDDVKYEFNDKFDHELKPLTKENWGESSFDTEKSELTTEITATFDTYYKIKFLNYDYSILEEVWTLKDKVPQCNVLPEKKEDETYHYVHSGWRPELEKAGSDESTYNVTTYSAKSYVAEYTRYFNTNSLKVVCGLGGVVSGMTSIQFDGTAVIGVTLKDGCYFSSLANIGVSIDGENHGTLSVVKNEKSATITIPNIRGAIKVTIPIARGDINYKFVDYYGRTLKEGKDKYGELASYDSADMDIEDNNYIYTFSTWYSLESDKDGNYAGQNDNSYNVLSNNSVIYRDNIIFYPRYYKSRKSNFTLYKKKLDYDLIEQFRCDECTVFDSLFNSIGKQLDDVYNFYYSLKYNRSLEYATGKQLDGIGDILNLSRASAAELLYTNGNDPFNNDDAYKQRLKYKILRNTGNCTYKELVSSISLLTGKYPFRYVEEDEATITLIYNLSDFTIDEIEDMENYVSIITNTEFIRASGVKINIIMRENDYLNLDYKNTEKFILNDIGE